MSDTQKSLDEFMKNYEAQNEEDKDLVGSGEYDERETMRADRDTIYSGYYLESYQAELKVSMVRTLPCE